MKTIKRIDYGFESDQNFRRSYAFTSNDFRIQQIKNEGFVVPWHIVDKEKKEVHENLGLL
jgi:hypothetical protein